MNNMFLTFLFFNLSTMQSFKTIYFFSKNTEHRNLYCNTHYNVNDTNNNQNNKNNNQNNKQNKKKNIGCDHRPFIKNVTQEQEIKYNFAKNLCMLQLLKTLQNNDVPIYYKLFLIDKYYVVPTAANDNTKLESGYNLLSGGLLDNWEFEF